MHLTPWTPRIQTAIEEVERTFFQQVLGPIAKSRSARLRLLCRIQAVEDRRMVLALKMLVRANTKKESLLVVPRDSRDVDELQWVCRDMAAMLRHEQFEKALEYLKQGISAGSLKASLFNVEGESLGSSRKRKIPYDIVGSIPVILKLPKVRHRQLAVK